MSISLIFDGKRFTNFSGSELLAAGVPQSVIDDAVLELQWSNIRNVRNKLIAGSDWTQTKDCPLSEAKVAEFTVYRQALRDLPQSVTAPADIEWPEKPTAN
ncbi:hypothetical protein CXF86_10915 [Shewanella sp. GutCb]|uniref:tail fiber assembly protein n=1 Tax=Shewanella sp. GutCb TaxID=2058315 RepID=UPI000C7A17C7|nr:tail fiber assembly protein [Shewanella sp. GutCb]PKG74794.1 hypothetical protein CXF86_10915 [Shewanella sp. GutCb]